MEHAKTHCPRCGTILLEDAEEARAFREGGEWAVRRLRLMYGLFGVGMIVVAIVVGRAVWEATHSTGLVIGALVGLFIAGIVAYVIIDSWRDGYRAGMTRLSVNDRMRISMFVGLAQGQEVSLGGAFRDCLALMGFRPEAIKALLAIRRGGPDEEILGRVRKAGLRPANLEVLRGYLGLVEEYMEAEARRTGLRWKKKAPAPRAGGNDGRSGPGGSA